MAPQIRMLPSTPHHTDSNHHNFASPYGVHARQTLVTRRLLCSTTSGPTQQLHQTTTPQGSELFSTGQWATRMQTSPLYITVVANSD